MEKSLKVLLVDSDKTALTIIKELLKQCLPVGSQIITAGSGEEALGIFLNIKDFDAVVTTMMLKEEINGFVLAKKIKMLKSATPIIAFITELDGLDIVEKCLESDFDACLKKTEPDKLPQLIIDSLIQVGG